MSETTVVSLPFLSARKLVDPFETSFDEDRGPVVTYEFRVDTRFIPDMPMDANARPSDAAKNRRVYKSVKNAALDGALDSAETATPGLFGYKHLGLNIIADKVEEVEKNRALIYFKPDQGVMNGGHGLAILRDLQQDPGIESMPVNFIKMTVFVGLPNDLIAEVAGANNTSVQVKAQSLLELDGSFEKLKEALRGTRLENDVQWKEGGEGSARVEDIVAMMTCFRSDVYLTTGDKRKLPMAAYSAKGSILDIFRKDLDGYEALAPRLPEILEFVDYVRTKHQKAYNEKGGRFGGLKFVDSIYSDAKGKKRKKPLPLFVMPFTGEEVEYRINIVAVYPIIAAFRQMIRRNGDSFEWTGTFQEVKDLWDAIALEVMESTKTACEDVKYNMNALGKSRNHWENIQRIVQINLQNVREKAMQKQIDAMRAALESK